MKILSRGGPALRPVLICFCFLLLSPIPLYASVVINEVAWMGTPTSHYHEWIELYNPQDYKVDLSGWTVKSLDERLSVHLSGKIPSQSYYLLERTSDSTLPDVTADQIYTGSLKNSGEHLIMIDGQGKKIEEIDCSDGWFQGDNKDKKTMERKNYRIPSNDSESWQTSMSSWGTPKKKNSDTNNDSPGNFGGEAYQIIISEALPSPQGEDSLEEWIELENKEGKAASLRGWSLSDHVGKTNTYTFSDETYISPKSFLVLPRVETKITLNNQGDKLLLKNPRKETVSVLAYEGAPLGKSYAIINQGWQWSEPTPNNPNKHQNSLSLTSQGQVSLSAQDIVNGGKKNFPPSMDFWQIGSVALVTALTLGVLVITLKKTLIIKRENKKD